MHTEFFVLQNKAIMAKNAVNASFPVAFTNGGRLFDCVVLYYEIDGIGYSAEKRVEHLATDYVGNKECCITYQTVFDFSSSAYLTGIGFKAESGELINSALLSETVDAGEVEVFVQAFTVVSGVDFSSAPEPLIEYLFGVKEHALTACVCDAENPEYVDDGTTVSVERVDGCVKITATLKEEKYGKYLAFFCDKAFVFKVSSIYIRATSETINPSSFTFTLSGNAEITYLAGNADLSSTVSETRVPKRLGNGEHVYTPFNFEKVKASDDGKFLACSHSQGITLVDRGNSNLPINALSPDLLCGKCEDFVFFKEGLYVLCNGKLKKFSLSGALLSEYDTGDYFTSIFVVGNDVMLLKKEGFSVLQGTSSLPEKLSVAVENIACAYDDKTMTLTVLNKFGVRQYCFKNGGMTELNYAYPLNFEAIKFVGGRYGRASVVCNEFVLSFNLINQTYRRLNISDCSAISQNGGVFIRQNGKIATVSVLTDEKFISVGNVQTESAFYTDFGLITEECKFYPFLEHYTLVDLLIDTLPSECLVYSETRYFKQKQRTFVFKAVV